MRDFQAFVRRHVAPLDLPAGREQKVVEEWAAQLEELYDALRADGLSDADAWRELRRQVADGSVLKEELVDAAPAIDGLGPARRVTRTGAWRATRARLREALLTGVGRDLRAGLRLVVRQPGFSAAIALTLAVCLGANAAIFAVVHEVVLRPLPVPAPDRVVGMGDVYPTITPDDILANDAPSYFDRLDAMPALESQALFTFWSDTIAIDGVPQEVRGVRATPSLFDVLRVPPALGRVFTEAEGQIGGAEKIILSHGLWQRLYGGAPDVVGRTLRLGWTGQVYTVVGVMPREFTFFDRGFGGRAVPAAGVEFWIPLALTPAQTSDAARTRYGYFHIGRLAPGATVEQAQAQLDAVHAETVRRFPQFNYAELGMYSLVTPWHEALTRGVRPTLYLLWAGAGFVLLIGAINVGHLALVRAGARRRELATRVALGASRIQLARQLLVEALVPALAGGAAGVAVGVAILETLAAAGLATLPHAGAVEMGAQSILFVAAISVVVGVLIGAVPAATAGAVPVQQVLGDGSRSATSGRPARFFRRTLVVTQVAVSVVLLIAATLLFGSLRHLLAIDPGFSPAGVVTATIFPPPSRYPDAAAFTALTERALARVRALPGVQAAGITSNIALSGFESPATVTAAGRPEPDGAAIIPSMVVVSPGYFEALSTPLRSGRLFEDGDRAGAQQVAIVDERLAARLWPGEDPLGRGLFRGDAGPYTVVGVVAPVRLEGLAGSIDAIGTAYFPQAQAPPGVGRLRWLAVQSVAEPAALVRALRMAVAEVDADLPIADVQTMEERTAGALVSERLATNLAALFAGVALFLSVLGLYSVLAHLVARRTREIGIRLALGSSVRGVFGLVAGEGILLVGAGLVLGLAGAVAVAGALEGLVVGVRPTDPLLLASVAAATGAVALLATVAPARRATRVNPVDVLAEP